MRRPTAAGGAWLPSISTTGWPYSAKLGSLVPSITTGSRTGGSSFVGRIVCGTASPGNENVMVSRPWFLFAELMAWRSEHAVAEQKPSRSWRLTTTYVAGAAATGVDGAAAFAASNAALSQMTAAARGRLLVRVGLSPIAVGSVSPVAQRGANGGRGHTARLSQPRSLD